jgi:hypothetical protein
MIQDIDKISIPISLKRNIDFIVDVLDDDTLVLSNYSDENEPYIMVRPDGTYIPTADSRPYLSDLILYFQDTFLLPNGNRLIYKCQKILSTDSFDFNDAFSDGYRRKIVLYNEQMHPLAQFPATGISYKYTDIAFISMITPEKFIFINSAGLISILLISYNNSSSKWKIDMHHTKYIISDPSLYYVFLPDNFRILYLTSNYHLPYFDSLSKEINYYDFSPVIKIANELVTDGTHISNDDTHYDSVNILMENE